ncbi:MAG: flavin reductase family protein [Lachnospiraceae bacterium]|nr:flavin reductase family protein [Lachnospiraceae bacterium]
MAKQEWKPGNMLYPLPAVLVSTRSKAGQDNLMTAAWAGTICSDPVMLSISVRKSRLTYETIMETGCFVVNTTTEEMALATDYCGVRSGRDEDKWVTMKLEKEEATHMDCPMCAASPICLECVVKESKDLGSHTMFIAEVVAVHADEQYINENGRFCFNKSHPLVYSHGEYHALGKYIGKFGYSVRKNQKKKKRTLEKRAKFRNSSTTKV